MFMSARWQEGRYAHGDTESSHMEGSVISKQFWKQVDRTGKAIAPLYQVLGIQVDNERYFWIIFLYQIVMATKAEIWQVDLQHVDECMDIM